MKGLLTGVTKEDHRLLLSTYHSSHDFSDEGKWGQVLQDKGLPLSFAILLWDFMLARLWAPEPSDLMFVLPREARKFTPEAGFCQEGPGT